MQKIIDSLTALQTAVQTEINAAVKAYNTAVASRSPIAEVVRLDPGQLQAARGCLATALLHANNWLAQTVPPAQAPSPAPAAKAAAK